MEPEDGREAFHQQDIEGMNLADMDLFVQENLFALAMAIVAGRGGGVVIGGLAGVVTGMQEDPAEKGKGR